MIVHTNILNTKKIICNYKKIRSYQRMGVGGGKKFKGTQGNIWGC